MYFSQLGKEKLNMFCTGTKGIPILGWMIGERKNEFPPLARI
jgi:hypothetical protein